MTAEPALDRPDLACIHRCRHGTWPKSERQSVQAPSRWPRCDAPSLIGPVTSWIAGRPADAAPMSCAGTVLSQPPISTTASIGWAAIISSVSIAIRLRYIMLVGMEEHLAQRYSGERPRQRARRQHPAR